ncbi:amino acid adenylation domain-containing protein [Streptacidiphilus sp. PB12-B1b]|uniref:amino acid adenylation domain-containing protein n=1 Tax=Streptacidiphilus sp. PB12-B1b TaxID=2705012 RepID=UPI0015FE4EF7|nr:amino acid adenylation domain-containing protein [Streptacidiphilus sp. PB12-B1b]QMU77158.1 amino acid adenylation domain-containing protein [Streptacidiphilus sp. PB12-B1b]
MSAGDPGERTGEPHLLLRNGQDQYAVWPTRLPVPGGWTRVGEPRPSAADCAAALDATRTETWSTYTRRPSAATRQDDGPDVRGAGPGAPAPTVTALVREQLRRDPRAWAVLCDGERLDYAELDRRAALLAGQLRRHGRLERSLVAVCLDRTVDLVVALLAVLRGGAAVLPLDPATPARRLAHLVRDAGAGLVLTNRAHRTLFAGTAQGPHPARVLTVEELASEAPVSPAAGPGPDAGAPQPDDPAYMIYTSGSTGPPKGIVTSNRALAGSLTAAAGFYGLAPGDRVAHLAALAFDTSLEQILAPLISGAAVVLTGNRSWAPTDLLHRIGRERITVADLTPAYWRGLLSVVGPGPDALAPLRLVIVGGEVVHTDHCREWLRRVPRTALVNAYGLTETTITSTACELTGAALGDGTDGAPAPVGRPLAGTQVHVLDAELQPVPPGVRGEVYIGGAHLAEGIWKQPGLTARQFLPDPHSGTPGGRMYRTGDLGRWRSDGSLEIIGRVDDQLKLRGFRIDPAEVEAVLSAQPGVGQAAVAARDRGDGERDLVAFYTPGTDHDGAPHDGPGAGPSAHGADGADGADGGYRAARLRSALAEVLPAHMVPVEYTSVERMPLSPNGKIDRRALPNRTHFVRGPREVRPQPPFVSGVAQLWSLILGVEQVAAEDDFFGLGGTSLLAMEMLARARVMFGIGVGQIRELTRSLLNDATLAAFARDAQLARAGTLADPESDRVDFAAEARLGLRLRRDASAPAPDWRRPSDVLLTGATGYCGIHLLNDLLEHTGARIHCLVRAADAEQARERINASAQRYLLHDLSDERVVPVPGDLARPGLGLAAGEFERLGAVLDVVYHFGAQVNFIYPYDQLRAVNVDATRELIRLAAPRGVPLHFASSLAVVAGFGAAGVRGVTEETPLDFADYLSVGYVETKWVCEQLLRQASAAGLPVSVHRLQDITGALPSGVLNTATEICALIRFIADSGLCPKVELPLDFLPADSFARAVGHIGAHHSVPGAVYHLTGPRPALLGAMADRLRRRGYPVEEIPYAAWVPRLIHFAAGHPTHPVTPFVPLFVDRCRRADMTVSEMYMADVFPQFSRDNAVRALADGGPELPPVDDRMLDGYLDFLQSTGYLAPAGSPADGA